MKPKKQEPEKRAPSEREVVAIDKARASRAARPARAQAVVKSNGKGVLDMEPQHSDADGCAVMVNEAFATTSDDFSCQGLLHLANTTNPDGSPATTQTMNSSLALLGAIGPRDELETALAMQMVATHELSMKMLARARAAGTLEHMKEYGNLATKLGRTFTGQMKELADWRRGGEQVVRHVHVYEGGQAMVAETIQIGGQGEGTSGRAHIQGALGPTMLGHDAAGNGVPIASGSRQEALPPSRGGKGVRRSTAKPE